MNRLGPAEIKGVRFAGCWCRFGGAVEIVTSETTAVEGRAARICVEQRKHT